jgi:hypothetical protein
MYILEFKCIMVLQVIFFEEFGVDKNVLFDPLK